MGTVWLAADDEEEGRRVAVKVFHPEMLERAGFFARFAREAEAGSRVHHPNVVSTFGAEMQISGGRRCFFLVMEHVEGRSLRDVLDDLRQVPEALAREIARQVACGLAAIHAAGLVHRDVKPENVLLTPDHVVRIADLGVAKVLDASHALTQEGEFAGSLAYASPEQIRGADVTGAADLYALGVVIHEMLTGDNPFLRENGEAVMYAHLDEQAPDVAERAPDTSTFAAEVVCALLAKDPAQRFASAAELAGVLEEGERSAWWREHEDEALRRRAHVPRVPVRRETALRGREGDLALLRESWARARVGKGNVVLLTGEAGIGKSRLVDALLAEMKSETAHVLYGSHAPSGGMSVIADALLAKLGAEDLEAKIGGYLTESPLLAVPLAALLRHEPAPEGAVSLQGDALHAALVRLMRGLAAEKPLVWVIEDLHFADEDSRKIVLSLARAVEGRPILLLLTSRPGVANEQFAPFDRRENFRRLPLGRLGAREVILLLADVFKSERLADKLGARVALASDGNPFFVFETIRALKQGNLITELPDGTWADTKEIDAVPVPPAVRDLVEARLRDLPREDRELLDLSAVQGFEFDADLVAAALGRKRFEVLRDLAQIERTAGVVRSAGRRFRFDHHQFQEVVYSDLSEPLREECHAALAATLETRAKAADKDPATLDGALCVDLCEHFLKGAQGERALRYLAAADMHLTKGYLSDAAIRLAERALAVPGLLAGAERAKTLLRLCAVLNLNGRRKREEEAAREAEGLAEAAADADLRGQAANSLGWCFYQTSRLAEAEASYRCAREMALSRGDKKAEGVAENGLGLVFSSQGRLDEAREQHERTLVIAREIGNRQGEAAATGNLGGVFYARGRLGEAREHYERSLVIAREIGDRQIEATVTGNLGVVLNSQGRLGEAREHHERRLAIAREIGDRRGEAQAAGNLGDIFASQGRLAPAREHFERQLAIAREIGDRQGEAQAAGNLGNALLEAGESAAGIERLSAVLALGEEFGLRSHAAIAYLTLGTHHRESGELSLARESLTKAREESVKIGDAGLETLARCQLSLLPGGDWRDALASWTANEGRMNAQERIDARWLLWKASGERTHLAEAKRLLDEWVSQMSAEDRASALANLRTNREIVAACKEQGL